MAVAKEVVIRARLDTDDSVSKIEQVKRSLGSIRGTNIGDVGERFKALNAALDSNTLTLRQMQMAVKEYTTIALHAGEESPIGKEAIARAAQLRDRLNDANARVNRLAHDGFKMQAAIQLSNTVINSYQAFTGITALLGSEQKELMQVMAKMQIVQQTLNALEQVRAAFEKESFIMLKARAAGMRALTAVQTAYASAVSNSNGALGKFRLALMATGIGAIVVSLGLLIANFDKVKSAVEAVSQKVVDFANKFSFVRKAVEFVSNAFSAVKEKVLDFTTGLNKAERAAVQLADNVIAVEEKKRQMLDSEYSHQINVLKARNKDTFNLEQQRLIQLRDSIDKEVAALREKERIKKGLEDEERQRLNALMEERRKHTQSLEMLEVEREQKRLERIRELAEKRKEEEERRMEREREMADTFEREKSAIIDRANEFRISQISDKYERELQLLRYKHERELAEIDAKDLAVAQKEELKAMLRQQQQAEQEALQQQQQMERERQEAEMHVQRLEQEIAQIESDELLKIAKQKELADYKRQQGIISEEQYFAEIGRIRRAEVDMEMRAVAARIQARNQLIGALGSALSSVAGIAREGSALQKAAALASIVADTATGFMNGLIIAQQAAKNTPADPITKGLVFASFYAAQIGAVISAASRAKQILGKEVNIPRPSVPTASGAGSQGGGGITSSSGGGGISGGTQEATGTSTANVAYDTVRVVVLESDITQVQNRNKTVQVASQL